jgi:hypothetical protein
MYISYKVRWWLFNSISFSIFFSSWAQNLYNLFKNIWKKEVRKKNFSTFKFERAVFACINIMTLVEKMHCAHYIFTLCSVCVFYFFQTYWIYIFKKRISCIYICFFFLEIFLSSWIFRILSSSWNLKRKKLSIFLGQSLLVCIFSLRQ